MHIKKKKKKKAVKCMCSAFINHFFMLRQFKKKSTHNKICFFSRKLLKEEPHPK